MNLLAKREHEVPAALEKVFPGVDELRHLAFADMDAALKLGLEMTLEHLARQGAEVSPESREALAWLNK